MVRSLVSLVYGSFIPLFLRLASEILYFRAAKDPCDSTVFVFQNFSPEISILLMHQKKGGTCKQEIESCPRMNFHDILVVYIDFFEFAKGTKC